MNSDAPQNSARHPHWGRPPATTTARNNGPQERTLWGRCRLPRPHKPCSGNTGREGTAPDTRRPSQPWKARDGPPPPLQHAAYRRGQCWAPTPAHLRPQHLGGEPLKPAKRKGSRAMRGSRALTNRATWATREAPNALNGQANAGRSPGSDARCRPAETTFELPGPQPTTPAALAPATGHGTATGDPQPIFCS